MEKLTIEIDSKWLRRVRSPMMWVIWTLQGVSVTFAPLFLFLSGTDTFYPHVRWFIAALCFAIIFLVQWFYVRLGGEVVQELRKHVGTANG